MKDVFLTIVIIVILALVGSPVLMWAMRAVGMLTGNTLG